MRIQAIAVVNEKGIYCLLCSACRQVIFEFGANAIVPLQEGDSLKELTATELLPEAFQLD